MERVLKTKGRKRQFGAKQILTTYIMAYEEMLNALEEEETDFTMDDDPEDVEGEIEDEDVEEPDDDEEMKPDDVE